ncbi:MAG: hypothetical protein NTW86_26400 [Candidatus Sumerlaeota bacterium]|nr:hypothetical protein [Candidatus Sumerlaeota bacterium]
MLDGLKHALRRQYHAMRNLGGAHYSRAAAAGRKLPKLLRWALKFGFLCLGTLVWLADAALYALSRVLPRPSSPSPADRPEIIYVAFSGHTRPLKQLAALKGLGRHRIAFFGHMFDPSLFSRYCDEVVAFRDVWHLKRLTRRRRPLAFHAFGQPSWPAKAVIETAAAPVVFDIVDSLTVMYGRDSQAHAADIADEKFCYERADGVVYKSPEIDYLKQWYDIQAPTIHLLDYCLEDFFAPDDVKPLSEETGEYHLFYTGAVFPMSFPRETHCYSQFADIAKVICDQGIHFHIFPNLVFRLDYSDYEQLDREHPFFHWEPFLPVDELNRRCARFDLNTKLHFLRGTRANTPEKVSTATGNKLFSGFEAGTPALVSDELHYEAQLLKEWGTGFAIALGDLPNLKRILDSVDLRAMRRNVIQLRRSELSMRGQIGRLAQFYESLRRDARGARRR